MGSWEERRAARQAEFERQLQRSRAIEIAVGQWLMRRGWAVLAVYDYSGKDDKKAPRLETLPANESLVTPDLLAARAGQPMCWVEVKLKGGASFYRKEQRYVTGISARLWDEYRKVQARTGVDVWIVFVHEKQHEIVGNTIDRLRPHARYDNSPEMGPMQFFPCAALRKVADWDAVFASEAAE